MTGGGVFRTDREGIALLVVLLITLVVAAIAAGAALIGSNSYLINQYDQRVSLLEAAADAGLERVRAGLNSNPSLFPTTGYAVIEEDVPVLDARGNSYTGVTRTTYAGPVGGGPGEYGTFGTIISVARDADGAEAIRRRDLIQESFAAYAYFTDVEPLEIAFGNNDQLYGPVHSNSNIKIRSTGATFHGPVTTAGVFEGAMYATFKDDTTSSVTPILMPTSSNLTQLESRATPGHMSFASPNYGTGEQSGTRIHFIARDVDNDGVKEGFIRVYQATDAGWVTGNVPSGGMTSAINCGHFHTADFVSHVGDYTRQLNALKSSTRRCYLGGADSIWGGTFTTPDTKGGKWLAYPGTIHPDVADEPDGAYLYPLERRFNPGFRGVIYVSGRVVVSGTVRGRVTLAATSNIIIADDIKYSADPGSATCTDMLGLFSGGSIVVADNMLNAPNIPATGEAYYTYDDTSDEHVHATLLSLQQIRAQNWSSGSTSTEPCGGTPWGRGCLYVTGGLIQQTRGPVGSGSGHGYVKRYTHDTCAFTNPPPYFPSTGHFWTSRYYEVDPTGFDPAAYFGALN